MPVTVGSVSSAEVAAANADLPMFVGNNVLESPFATAVWKAGTATWASGASITDPNYPTKYLYDRKATSPSRPLYASISGVNTVTLLFDLNPGTDGPHSIDTFMIWGHNSASLPGATITWTIQVADDNAFSTNLRTLIAFSNGGSAARMWSFGLGSNNRYTNVEFARLTIATSATNFANGSGVVPSIGEIFLGRRRQMTSFPLEPYDNMESESDTVEHKSRNGVIRRYARSIGRREFQLMFRSGGLESVYSPLIQSSELRSLWNECAFGSKPFLFVPNPVSNNFPFVAIAEDPLMSIPILGPFEREMQRMTLTECAPFVQPEGPGYPI